MSTQKILKSTDGTDIYADATGNPQNPSIVFVHGLTLCGGVFDELFANQRLSEKFYLVRYDMRGHGRSGSPETPQSHSSSLYADDFMAVVSAFGLNKPILVGWSLGAAVIGDICINVRPPPISGAIALNGTPSLHGQMIPTAFLPRVFSIIEHIVSPDTAVSLSGRRDWVDACFHDPEGVPFAQRSAWVGYTTFQTSTTIGLIGARQQDTPKLSQLTRGDLRFMVVYGNEDKLVSGAATAKELVRGKYFGDVEVEVTEIDGGGHAVFVDHMDEVVDAVIGFAESVRA